MKNPTGYLREILHGIRKIDELEAKIVSLENKVSAMDEAVRGEMGANWVMVREQNKQISDSLLKKNFEYLNFERDVAKKQILILGYYGAPNFGDEVMLQSLLEILDEQKDIREEFEITVMVADNLDFDNTSYSGVKLIRYPKNLFDINSLAYMYDIMLVGGGGVLLMMLTMVIIIGNFHLGIH